MMVDYFKKIMDYTNSDECSDSESDDIRSSLAHNSNLTLQQTELLLSMAGFPKGQKVIQREIKDGFILKHISFTAANVAHSYTERVKYLDLSKMTSYLNKAGFQVEAIFGDYNLTTFEKNTSDRLILVAK